MKKLTRKLLEETGWRGAGEPDPPTPFSDPHLSSDTVLSGVFTLALGLGMNDARFLT